MGCEGLLVARHGPQGAERATPRKGLAWVRPVVHTGGMEEDTPCILRPGKAQVGHGLHMFESGAEPGVQLGGI